MTNGGPYVWEIPTRADVDDSAYQALLRKLELSRQVEMSSWPTSSVLLHNHVNSALKHCNVNNVDAEKLYARRILGRLYIWTRPEVEKLLRPEWLMKSLLNIINSYERALDCFKKELDVVIELTKMSVTKGSHHASALVEVKELRPLLSEDPNRNFSQVVLYKFNIYSLAKERLNLLRKRLLAAGKKYAKHADPLGFVQVIYRILQEFDNDFNKTALLGSAMHFDYIFQVSDYERNSPSIGHLMAENETIVRQSDVGLRFDAAYFRIKAFGVTYELPFIPMVDDANRTSQAGLLYRTLFKDLVGGIVISQGKVIINGIEFSRVKPEEPDDLFYQATENPPQYLVNLLGWDIFCAKARTKKSPELWAEQERYRVSQYRKLIGKSNFKAWPILPITRSFLATYDGFGPEDGITTEDDKLEHLFFTLKGNNVYNHVDY